MDSYKINDEYFKRDLQKVSTIESLENIVSASHKSNVVILQNEDIDALNYAIKFLKERD